MRLHGFYPFDNWLGENLAQGYDSGLAVLEATRASPAYSAILPLPEYHAVGLVCLAQSSNPTGWFWVADFGGVAD